MSVAETPPIMKEQTPRGGQQVLALGSVVGALYVLIGLWVVLAGLPLLWSEGLQLPDLIRNEYLSTTLLGIVCCLAATGIAYFGYLLMRNQQQPGLRAGIVVASISLFVALWIGEAIANLSSDGEAATLALGGIVALVIAGVTGFFFLQPGFGQLLDTVEHQGWFHGFPFKPNQGVRVRRGTVVGVLVVGFCGIITLILRNGFGSERYGANDWVWIIPGTGAQYFLPLLYKLHLLLPVLLSLALIYFSWRLVNVPVFADFLIATEAEMNKVSWTTRRRLVQDTIVVLVTVVLLTMFLFAIDVMWIKILNWPWIGVLRYDQREQNKQQQDSNQW